MIRIVKVVEDHPACPWTSFRHGADGAREADNLTTIMTMINFISPCGLLYSKIMLSYKT